jgi:hypothetical protein
MIWRWFGIGLLWLVRLVWPDLRKVPPSSVEAWFKVGSKRRIDPNTACPICGNKKGTLQAWRVEGNPQQAEALVTVGCKKCGARQMRQGDDGLFQCAACGVSTETKIGKTSIMLLHICATCGFGHWRTPVGGVKWPAM